MVKLSVINLFIFTLLLSITGCVTYNPNAYNPENKRYCDYRKNYSITILDGYQLVEHKAAHSVSVVGRYYIPDDSTIFYNKKKGSYFYISWNERVPHDLIADTKRWKYYMAENLKHIRPGAETVIYKDAVIGEFEIKEGVKKSKALILAKPYQPSKAASQFAIIRLGLVGDSFKAEVDRNDLIKLFDSLKLTFFDEEERYAAGADN